MALLSCRLLLCVFLVLSVFAVQATANAADSSLPRPPRIEEELQEFFESVTDDLQKEQVSKKDESEFPLPGDIQVQGVENVTEAASESKAAEQEVEDFADDLLGMDFEESQTDTQPLGVGEIKVEDIAPPPVALPENFPAKPVSQQLSEKETLQKHMQDFIDSLRKQGVIKDEPNQVAAGEENVAEGLDDLLDLDLESDTPEQQVAVAAPKAVVPEVKEEESERVEERIKNEILARNPGLTEKQIYAYVGTCMGFPEALKECQPYQCKAPKEAGSQIFVERKILGSEDGKCFFVDKRVPEGNTEMECALENQESVMSFAVGVLERYYQKGKFVENSDSNPVYQLYDKVRANQCKINTGNNVMEKIADVRARKEREKQALAQVQMPENVSEGAQPGMQAQPDQNAETEAVTPPVEVASADAPQTASPGEPVEAKGEETASQAQPPVLQEGTIQADVVQEPVSAPETDKPAEEEVSKPQITEADRAYFAMLDEKKNALPKHKQLSGDTSETMNDISSALAKTRATNTPALPQHLTLNRENENADEEDELPLEEGETKKPAINLSMTNAGDSKTFDTQRMLEEAYRALLAGQIAAATNIYKTILDRDHDNLDALFGLATSYHRNAQFEQARAIYTEILHINPNHTEALNNFLVLAAEEAPENALIELEKLERINPRFSPVPAQIAMIYLKMDMPKKAERYLKRSVILSPENIVYKYNLAITSDRLGKFAQAIDLYRELLQEVREGAVIPGSTEDIRKRLAFLQKNQ